MTTKTKTLFEMLLKGGEFDYSPSEDKMAAKSGFIVLIDDIVRHSFDDEEGIAKTLQKMWGRATEEGLYISCWTDDRPCLALSRKVEGLNEALKEDKGGLQHRIYCLSTSRWFERLNDALPSYPREEV